VVTAYPTATMGPVEDPMAARTSEVAEGTLVSTDFVDCYQTHYRRLIRALQLSGADQATAQDVAQEAFARAFARWRSVSKGSNPAGYVYTTAFRLLSRNRSRSARLSSLLGFGDRREGPSTRSSSFPDPADGGALTAIAVETALNAMPPRRRTCAVMCLVLGLSVHEVALALRIADGTVRKHLEEARRDLRVACDPRF
jgi:RNA polymerase sigma-70 factor, ECF subfamily